MLIRKLLIPAVCVLAYSLLLSVFSQIALAEDPVVINVVESISVADSPQVFPPAEIETATGTGTASFWPSSGTIENLTAVTEDSLPSAGKPDLQFPHGFFSFDITGLSNGETVTATIELPSAVPVGTQYWKYHDPEGWIQIPMGSDDGDNVIAITLVDGGLGDDDGLADGTIIDQGGPGHPPTLHIDSSPFLFCYPGATCDLPDALTNIGPDGLNIVTTVWGTVDGQWFSHDAEIGAGFLTELVNGRPYVMTHEDGVCNDWVFTAPPSPTPTPTPETLHIDSNPFLFCYPGATCTLPEALTNIGPEGLNMVTTVWGTVDGQWVSYDAVIGAGFLRELVNGNPYVVTHEDGVCNDWEMQQ